jgi:glycosidase
VNPDYQRGINVRDQEHNPNSLLNYYKLLLKVRKQTIALIEGDYIPLNNTSKDYLAFLRKSPDQTVLVVLNYSDQPKELDFSRVAQIKGQNLRVLFSSAERLFTTKPPRGLAISPFEVFIAEIQPAK